MQLINLLGVHIELPIWLILIIVAVAAYYIYMTWHYGVFEKLDIPYEKPIPILGTTNREMKLGHFVWDRKLQKKYGRVCGLFLGYYPQMLISDPEILKHILVKDFPAFTNRLWFVPMDKMESTMMVGAQDDVWRAVRTTCTPTFSSGKMRKMLVFVNECGDYMLKHLEDDPASKVEINFRKFAGNFTMDAIARVGFGIQLDSASNANSDFVKYAEKFFNFSYANYSVMIGMFLPFLVPLLCKFNYSFFPKESKEFFLSVIKKAISERGKREVNDTDLLQLMMDAHNLPDEEPDTEGGFDMRKSSKRKLTEDELLGQALQLFLAGYETTANTLGFIAHCLATNPECQAKVREEIQEVLQGKIDPSYDDLNKMVYLQQVIDETLRLYPQAQRTNRRCNETIDIKGLLLPKGMDVQIPVMAMHYDPEFYPEPEKFDPERFSPAAKAQRNPYTYLPWGLGPRNCIGMRLAIIEMKVAIIKVLQKYTFQPSARTKVPLELKLLRQTIAKDGYWVKLKEEPL